MSTPGSDPTGAGAPRDVTDSDEDTSPGSDGGMGVSSERVGPTGPGQEGTSGTRYVGPADDEAAAGESRPEQSPGGVEVHPDPPVPPVAGYNSHDPRADEHPYEP